MISACVSLTIFPHFEYLLIPKHLVPVPNAMISMFPIFIVLNNLIVWISLCTVICC